MGEEMKKSSGGDQGKVYAIVGYLGILFLVPLLAAPNDKFAQYHARQGMVLFIAEVILWIVAWLLMLVTFGFGVFFMPVVSILAIIWSILGIVNAANGEMKPLPVIGHYAKGGK